LERYVLYVVVRGSELCLITTHLAMQIIKEKCDEIMKECFDRCSISSDGWMKGCRMLVSTYSFDPCAAEKIA